MSVRILLTGATGYVGGTVLSTLLSSGNAVIRNSTISVLVREEAQGKILDAKGVHVIPFGDFDDDEKIRKAASEHDVVVHTASGFHTGCARSLILGLAERRKKLGSEVYYFHTSGTSSLADSPVLRLYPNHPQGTQSDRDPAHVVTTLVGLEDAVRYPQRTTDLAVLSLGQETGVKTHIFFLPILYGLGLGEFNKISGQIPILMEAARLDGYTSLVGDGEGIKSHIHIEDVGSFYETLIFQVLEGKIAVPHSREGVFFVESGQHSYRDISEGIAKAAFSLGIINNQEVRKITTEEAVKKFKGSAEPIRTELAFVSSIRVSADIARSLGWRAHYQKHDFAAHYVDMWKAILERDGSI